MEGVVFDVDIPLLRGGNGYLSSLGVIVIYVNLGNLIVWSYFSVAELIPFCKTFIDK